MSLTYPYREEAKRYRRELQDAVAAVRTGEEPERDALAWPAGEPTPGASDAETSAP